MVTVTTGVMSASNIAPTVRALVEERVHSIEQLEVLLLLHRRRDQPSSAEAVARELGIALELVSSALRHLADSGLTGQAEGTSEWLLRPESAAVAAQVDQLAETYKTARVELIVQISTSAMQRVRNAGLRAFAQAFLVKGPKDRG